MKWKPRAVNRLAPAIYFEGTPPDPLKQPPGCRFEITLPAADVPARLP